MQRRSFLLSLAAGAGFGCPAIAAARRYRLEPQGSAIQFNYSINNVKLNGSLGIGRADMVLDFRDVRQTDVDVTLDVRDIRANNPIATQALRGANVLDVGRFPDARFVSRTVVSNGGGARVDGDLTLRGVSQPQRFDVTFHQSEGGLSDVEQDVTLLLTGTLDRTAFGASGFSELVGPNIDLVIVARVVAV